MFPSLGMGELLIIGLVALIVFGPRKLPELGRSLGKTLQEFRRASNELKHTLDEEISLEERTAQRQKATPSLPEPAETVAHPVTDTVAEPAHDASPEPAESVARGQQ